MTADIRHALRGRGSRNWLWFGYHLVYYVTPCEGVGVEIRLEMSECKYIWSRLARAWE